MATATEWTAATAKFRWNEAGTGKSVGAGFLGSDGFSSCDLGDGRTLFVNGDTNYATGAGQRPFYGGGDVSPPGSFAATPRNAVTILVGNDISTAPNPITYVRTDLAGRPTAFLPDVAVEGVSYFRFPGTAQMIDGKLFLWSVLAFNTSDGFWAQPGLHCTMYDNVSATSPLDWIPVELPTSGSLDAYRGQVGGASIDAGDGYIYCHGGGPADTITIARIKREDFSRGRLTNPEWWDGDTGWFPDRGHPGQRTLTGGGERGPRGGLIRHRTSILGFPDVMTPGNYHRRPSDGKYQFTCLKGFPFSSDIAFGYSLKDTPGEQWETLNSFALPAGPSTGFPNLIYNPSAHLHLTWAGKADNNTEQVWSIAINNTNEYFPRFYKVTGLT